MQDTTTAIAIESQRRIGFGARLAAVSTGALLLLGA